jgi:hypothetical protein
MAPHDRSDLTGSRRVASVSGINVIRSRGHLPRGGYDVQDGCVFFEDLPGRLMRHALTISGDSIEDNRAV